MKKFVHPSVRRRKRGRSGTIRIRERLGIVEEGGSRAVERVTHQEKEREEVQRNVGKVKERHNTLEKNLLGGKKEGSSPALQLLRRRRRLEFGKEPGKGGKTLCSKKNRVSTDIASREQPEDAEKGGGAALYRAKEGKRVSRKPKVSKWIFAFRKNHAGERGKKSVSGEHSAEETKKASAQLGGGAPV